MQSQRIKLKNFLYSGLYHYHSFYIGASTPLLEYVTFSPEPFQAERLDFLITDLKPHAVLETDLEYAAILHEKGSRFMKKKEYENALTLFKEAETYQPYLKSNVYSLIISNFILKNYQEAHRYLPYLVGFQYPDLPKALRVAIHVSLEANAYEDAQSYCNQLLEVNPNDDFIRKVEAFLDTTSNPAGAKLMFKSE